MFVGGGGICVEGLHELGADVLAFGEELLVVAVEFVEAEFWRGALGLRT